MKKLLKLFGIIALVALIGLSFAACGDDSTGGGGGGGGGGNPPAPPTYTLDGVWETSKGTQVTVSGSTGILTFFNTSIITDLRTLDAISKGYLKVGDQYWRNLTSTGNLTWSGQHHGITFNNSNPDVATGTGWMNSTFTMSANGQTLTVDGTDIWTRRSAPLSLDGVWETSKGTQVTVNGSTGILTFINTTVITDLRTLDAIDKGYLKVGDQYWRNLKSTGNLTWSGQHHGITFNKSNPDVATGTGWMNSTFTMSANGQTLTVDGTDIWTRR